MIRPRSLAATAAVGVTALALAGFSPDGADDIPAIPRGAWVIGSRSDARLARRESSLKATGSGLLLSRFAGFMFRAQDRAAAQPDGGQGHMQGKSIRGCHGRPPIPSPA